MNPEFRILTAFGVLAVTAACGSSTGPKQTEANTAPTVQITQSHQVGGYVPASQQVMVHFQDRDTESGNLPSILTFTVDGAAAGTINLSGAAGDESFLTQGLSEGTHTLEAKVCDAGGLCGQDATSFETQAAHYIATLRIFDGIDFLPGEGTQLCLDDLCELADSEGIARLENIGTGFRVVSVQGDVLPNAMAGLATKRIDYNFFNLTPEMARTGHVPKDEQIELGENKRTILLFSEDFPVEEYANRWWLPSLQDPYGLYLPPRTPHRVNLVEGNFQLSTEQRNSRPYVPEQELQQLYDDINKMTALVMDSVYSRIGFTEPFTYRIEEAGGRPPLGEGEFLFVPNQGQYDFRKLCNQSQIRQCDDYSLTYGLRLYLDDNRTFDAVRWQARMSVFKYFCGIEPYDAAKAGGLTTYAGLTEDLVLDPTQEEIAMCVMGTAFGPRAIMRDSTTVAGIQGER